MDDLIPTSLLEEGVRVGGTRCSVLDPGLIGDAGYPIPDMRYGIRDFLYYSSLFTILICKIHFFKLIENGEITTAKFFLKNPDSFSLMLDFFIYFKESFF